MSAAVSIVKCRAYHEDTVYQKVKEAVDLLGGIKNFVSPGQRILLKPNLAIGRPPENCVNTHPLVVKAVALLVKEAGATVLIGDSPMLGSAKKAANKCGLEEIAQDLGVDIVEFEPATFQNPDGRIFKSFTIGKIIKEVDRVINISKLKTHALMVLTLSVKNMFGCVPATRKGQWHVRTSGEGLGVEYFAQMLLDLNYFVNPVLNIVDGVIGMEGQGPGFGDPRHFGLLIAGTDGVALDRIISEMLNIKADRVPVLRVANREGYGVAKLEDINTLGERLEDHRVSDLKLAPKEDGFAKLPKSLKKFLKVYVTTRPLINQEKCEACEMCAQACPLSCIAIDQGRLEIDRHRCIQCLCCMEICPNGAIDLIPGSLLKASNAIKKLGGRDKASHLQT